MRLLEKSKNISTKKHWLAITLGIILGVFVLGSSMHFTEASNEVVEQSDTPGQEVVSELTIEAVPSGGQTSIERNSYLIETLPEIEEPESEDVEQENRLPSPAKFFKILFECIISPNSP